MSALTKRDREVIEVALESAISACGTGFGSRDNSYLSDLAAEYRHALASIRELGEMEGDPW